MKQVTFSNRFTWNFFILFHIVLQFLIETKAFPPLSTNHFIILLPCMSSHRTQLSNKVAPFSIITSCQVKINLINTTIKQLLLKLLSLLDN